MKQINTLSLLILFGSLSSALLGMDFSFNEEYRKEEIKGMSRQQCLAFRIKQLHQLKEEAIKEILSITGISKEKLDTSIKNYKHNKHPLKRAYHDAAIPQNLLSIIIQTLEEEGINPNNISIKTTNDSSFSAAVKSKIVNNFVEPIKLYVNLKLLYHNLHIQYCILHEISHIKNDDIYWQYFLKDVLLRMQIKHDPNSKNLNQKNALLINKFTQSFERIAMLNPSCKSKKLAEYRNRVIPTFKLDDRYPPMEDLREWSTRFCDCWDLPETRD